METPPWKQDENGIIKMEINSSIYSVSSCLRVSHALSATHSIKLDRNEVSVVLTIVGLNGRPASPADADKVLRMLTDFTLRERLDAETVAIRNTILAQAFDRTGLSKP